MNGGRDIKIFLCAFVCGCIVYHLFGNTLDKKAPQRDGENCFIISARGQAPVLSRGGDNHIKTPARDQTPAWGQGQYLPPSPCRADFPLHSNMTELQLEKAYFSFLDKTHHRCNKAILMGNKKYGGWNICLDPDFELHPPCLVYSFGIGPDWSFDDYMAKTIGCQVFSFDPSIDLRSHQRNENNTFFEAGLGGYVKSKGLSKGVRSYGHDWELKTLGQWMKHLKHDKMIVDVVKFDTEGDEWPALEAMLAEGSLENVRQLAWEAHSSDGPEAFYPHATAIHALENDHGFRKWYSSRSGCPGFEFKSQVKGRNISLCHNMVFVNSRFLTYPKCED